MRHFARVILTFAVILLVSMFVERHAVAETVRTPVRAVPSGKGFPVDASQVPEREIHSAHVTSNGISWHGGPVMGGAVNVYYIWYGNWTNGPHASDSATTVNLLDALYGANGIGGSPYELINSTYYDSGKSVTGNAFLVNSTTDNYSQGKTLSDSAVETVVSHAITGGALGPADPNGLYFVLTSSDVAESSGFCNIYCGWHTNGTISGTDIKYAFVGNPDRCPSSCEMQVKSPNNDSGADGMASIMAHEGEEMLTDPDLNAWFDRRGAENADKCAWKFGPTTGQIGNGAYNQTFINGTHWLIQLNWENASGGGCAQRLNGPFYSN